MLLDEFKINTPTYVILLALLEQIKRVNEVSWNDYLKREKNRIKHPQSARMRLPGPGRGTRSDTPSSAAEYHTRHGPPLTSPTWAAESFGK